MCLRRKVFEQCLLLVLNYGAETVTTKIKKDVQKLHRVQRKMEISMMRITLKNEVKNQMMSKRVLTPEVELSQHVGRITEKPGEKITKWRHKLDAFKVSQVT